MRKSIIGAACTCLAIVSFSANSALIDNGYYTTDTDTGLDWLDVTESIGRSYNDVVSQFGVGGDYEGWHYANQPNFIQLWHNILGNNPTGNVNIVHASSSSVLLPWIQVFGDTSVYESESVSYTHGFTLGHFAGRPITARVYVDGVYDHFTDSSASSHYGDNKYLSVGSWLIRDTSASVVPIPTSLWLFGSGLIGLVSMARRKA